MKKIILVLLTTLCLFGILPACGAQSTDPNTSENEATYTGVIEEKKDFMVIVNSEDGNDPYIFNLDGITCDAEVGDKVTVTYTGDLNDIDSVLTATKIEKTE